MIRPTFLLFFFFFSVDVNAQQKDDFYAVVSSKICSCIEDYMNKLSPETRHVFNAILDATNDEEATAKVQEYMSGLAPEKMQKVLEELDATDKGSEMVDCMTQLETMEGADDITASEEEIIKEVLQRLSTQKNCRFAYLVMRKGVELEKP